jgi:hypothetical protein
LAISKPIIASCQGQHGSGRIRDVRIIDPKIRTIEGVRVMQVSREVDWAGGTTTFSIEARLIGPDRASRS